MTIYSKLFWRLISIMSFILLFAVDPVFCEPITGALILGGASILGGLMSLYGTSKGGKLQVEAQREANAINVAFAEKASAEDKRRFEIQNALANMNFRLYKDELQYTKEEATEKKNFDRAFGFANRLVDLANSSKQQGLTAIQALKRT